MTTPEEQKKILKVDVGLYWSGETPTEEFHRFLAVIKDIPAKYVTPARPPSPLNPDVALREECEHLQVQLAACLTAAEGATRDPAKHGDYGWSPAYQAVLDLRIHHDDDRKVRQDRRRPQTPNSDRGDSRQQRKP